MNINKNILTKNDCYNSGKRIKPIGMQLHSIGTSQNTADSLASYWNQSGVEACVHYCVDAETEDKIMQFLPDDYRSWADGGFGNNNLITTELMESDYMKYTSGANYIITDEAKFKADITRAYNTAVKFFAYKCKEYGWNPTDKLPNGLYVVSSHDEGRVLGVSTSHVDPTHIWSKIGKTMDDFRADVKAEMDGNSSIASTSTSYYRVGTSWENSKCVNQLGAYTVKENAINACPYGYKVFDEDGNVIYTAPLLSGTQASEFANLTEEQAAAKILEMAREDYVKTGILCSITAAQMILESGYVKTELATKANNCFGMKTSLSGNTWANSTWDGVSKVNIRTAEEYTVGNITYINADFRKYPCIEDSIADHSAYLLGAMNGNKLRYDGLKGLTDYKQAITLIKKGGYATDSGYISKICSIIERFGLDKYDKIDTDFEEPDVSVTPLPETDKFYRVGTAWKNGNCVNQIGAYTVLDNAKKAVADKSGYKVFDWDGNVIFPVTESPTTSISYYRVGTAWEDGKCVKQLGAYTNLDNAKKKADDYGFKVFDENGNVVYTAKPLTIPELAVKWAIDTANDNSHGYDNTKGSRGGTPDYACSSFVGAAYKFAGVDLPAPETIYTASMNKIFTPKGFKKIISGINFKTGKGLELGDIPVAPGKHTEIYVGNGKLAGARGNANSGKPENGKAGDQSGSEIAVSAYWNYPWSFVLRYVGNNSTSSETTSTTYIVQAGSFTVKANAEALVKKLKSKEFNAIVKTSGSNYIVQCGSFSVKENAEALKDKLIAAGFTAIVK